MAKEDFKLPGSSLEEIEKIVEAYSEKSGPVSNDEIASLCGLSRSTVSRNNGFLAAVGLIEGGQKKAATELGRNLGRAIRHKQEDDIKKYWQQAVAGNSFLSEQVTAVRVQRGVKTEDLPSKILYNSKASKNHHTEAGARAIAEILARGGLLEEVNGKYEVARESKTGGSEAPAARDADTPLRAAGEVPTSSEQNPPADVSTPPPPVVLTPAQPQLPIPQGQPISLAINLQLQLPEFEDTKKYEDLFRALRKHLMAPPGAE